MIPSVSIRPQIRNSRFASFDDKPEASVPKEARYLCTSMLRCCYLLGILWLHCGEMEVESFVVPTSPHRTSAHSAKTSDAPEDGSNSDATASYSSLTASQQARREEERRKLERIDEVIPGQTSAVPGEKDFPLQVQATQEQWMQQASAVEQQVFQLTEEGLQCLKDMRLSEASAAFDAVFELKPNAYVWQAGIARFYLGDLDGAADVLARCASTFESRFGEPASEERIWRNACILKKYYSMSKKQRKEFGPTPNALEGVLASIPEKETTAELLRSERRKVVRVTHDLFSASTDLNHLDTIVARAQLRSMGGVVLPGFQPQMDQKMWKIQAWFYMGLHYDTLGMDDESKRCLKTALRLCPNANSDDILHSLPMLHMTVRDWFDDDVDMEPPGDVRTSVAQTILADIDRLTLGDTQDALRSRGLSSSGSKIDVQERLLKSLLTDEDLLLY